MLNIGRQTLSLQKWFRPIAQQPMGTYDTLLFKLDNINNVSNVNNPRENNTLTTCCQRFVYM